MKKLFAYLIALSVLLPTSMVAANSTPQKPPKITRPSKPTSKPNVRPNSGKPNSGKTNSGRSNTGGRANTGKTQAQKEQEELMRQNEELRRQQAEAERKRKQEEAHRQQQQASWQLTNRTFTVNGVDFTMMSVLGGTFQMGSNYGNRNEMPIHSVTLTDYYIGQTEVTQALWKAVMGSNPSYFKGDNRPVEQVSWNDCQTFINKLNRLTGEHFCLPTEAEWEFAAKGGRQSRGFKYSGGNIIGDVAWYDDNSGGKTHPVATKSPNELGIYDMSGNVWEWCQDWYGDYSSSSQANPTGPTSGSNRVLRGGNWIFNATYCQYAHRNYGSPDGSYTYYGLRLALSE